MVGIDEVGRGPLAGPVAVGAVLVPYGARARVRRLFRGIRDSKKLSADARERWAKLIRAETGKGTIAHAVIYASSADIDRRGIAPVIRSLVARSLKRLGAEPGATEVLLDGSLRAPAEFMRQRTIIKGDDTIMEISMASVIAKVSRDALMSRMGRRYPDYGFEAHKGYGTAAHMQSLRRSGPCPIHRLSFLRNLMKGA